MIFSIFQKSFYRKAVHENWGHFTHLLIKVRGDGRRYALILHTPGYWDYEWHDYYAYPFYTHGGPYWQYAKVQYFLFFVQSSLSFFTDVRLHMKQMKNVKCEAII